jgi:palmitoyltransferase
MLVRSLEMQCGARAAHAAGREDVEHPGGIGSISGSTQLMRAAMRNNLPRLLQLVQLGAPLDLADATFGESALYWSCARRNEAFVKALLDGKYEDGGAAIDSLDWKLRSSLMVASYNGREGVVRMLLARGARQELQDNVGCTALHWAVIGDHPAVVALLCAAPGAFAALAMRSHKTGTPLAFASSRSYSECEAVLRAHGARY